MKATEQDLLAQARRSVAAARLMLESGYPEVAVSRAYYAMFYCASALLEGEGLRFSSHSAVIGGFGEQVARAEQFVAAAEAHIGKTPADPQESGGTSHP